MSEEKIVRRWKLTRAEIAQETSVLIPGENWNPLDGPPPPEYIPDEWDGPHVGNWLKKAFKTLAALPGGNGGGKLGFWPQMYDDPEDDTEQVHECIDKIDPLDSASRITKGKPSARDISLMEEVISWPGAFLAHDPEAARTVQRVAFYKAMDKDMDTVARRMRRKPKELRADNRAGLDMIATALRRAQVPVF